MRMGLKVLVGAVVALAALAAVVATRPSEYRVARATTIAAPPAVVFAQINDFHKWETWNPWGQLDPGMKQTYEGAPAGVGAVYTWAGNHQVGEGRMTIVESRPNEQVRVKLDFYKPFAGTSVATFTLAPQGTNQTLVAWSMEGQNNFIAKAMHMVINMDKMIGGQFEKGLAAMKTAAEAASKS
jgi:Polyketide cyclase / dehydrase and lipid transport.